MKGERRVKSVKGEQQRECVRMERTEELENTFFLPNKNNKHLTNTRSKLATITRGRTRPKRRE